MDIYWTTYYLHAQRRQHEPNQCHQCFCRRWSLDTDRADPGNFMCLERSSLRDRRIGLTLLHPQPYLGTGPPKSAPSTVQRLKSDGEHNEW